MIVLGAKDTMRCLTCVVEWTGLRTEACWSCGGPGVSPWTDPAAMLKLDWPSMCSPYTERAFPED